MVPPGRESVAGHGEGSGGEHLAPVALAFEIHELHVDTAGTTRTAYDTE
jgi:hypothetical protein